MRRAWPWQIQSLQNCHSCWLFQLQHWPLHPLFHSVLSVFPHTGGLFFSSRPRFRCVWAHFSLHDPMNRKSCRLSCYQQMGCDPVHRGHLVGHSFCLILLLVEDTGDHPSPLKQLVGHGFPGLVVTVLLVMATVLQRPRNSSLFFTCEGGCAPCDGRLAESGSVCLAVLCFLSCP